jgi:hypothetical protein
MPGLQSRRVIRRTLLRVPLLGRWVERRWMPDPVERDAHRELVRERLEAPIATPVVTPVPTNEALPPQLTGSANED